MNVGLRRSGRIAVTQRAVATRSRLPLNIRVRSDGEAAWQPTATVVLAGCGSEGPSFRSCCQVLNFFASAQNAERYLRAHPEVEGVAISIPEAVAVGGEAVFGDVLGEA